MNEFIKTSVENKIADKERLIQTFAACIDKHTTSPEDVRKIIMALDEFTEYFSNQGNRKQESLLNGIFLRQNISEYFGSEVVDFTNDCIDEISIATLLSHKLTYELDILVDIFSEVN